MISRPCAVRVFMLRAVLALAVALAVALPEVGVAAHGDGIAAKAHAEQGDRQDDHRHATHAGCSTLTCSPPLIVPPQQVARVGPSRAARPSIAAVSPPGRRITPPVKPPRFLSV